MPHVVASAALRAEIDPTTGAIVALDHVGRAIRLVSTPVSRPPFRVELVGLPAIESFQAVEVDGVEGAIRTTWRLDQGLTLVGEVAARGHDLVFRASLHGAGTATIRRLTYPILRGIGRISGAGLDELAHSHGTGMLFHDPLDLFEPDPENRRKLRRSPYPEGFAGATMQWFAYYGRGRGGVLFGTEDRARSLKWLDVERDADGLTFSVTHASDAPVPGEAYSPAYPVVIAALDDGTWTAAADRYRSWVRDQAWTQPGPRSDWLRHDVGIATFGINARHDRSGWLDAIHAVAGTPVFHVLGPNWPAYGQDYRGHLPRVTGDWFPAAFAEANLAAIRRNGDRWAPFEFDLFAADPPDDREPVLASRYAMDPVESAISDGGLPRFPFMCPATPYWRAHHVARDVRLVRDHGVDAVYYDISVNNVLLQCEGTGHGHLPGSGEPIAAAFDAMYEATREGMTEAAGHHVPMGAEVISEAFLAAFDFHQARAESGPYAPFEAGAFRDWLLDGRARKIPAFRSVFGPAAPIRLDGWAKLCRASGDLFYWVAATVLANGGLVEVNGEFSGLETLPDGRRDDPAEHYYAFLEHDHPIDPAKAAFLGAIARTRVGPANRFLADGWLLPEPTVDAPEVELDYRAENMSTSETAHDERGTMRVPSVVVSAWGHGGSTAWLVANVIDARQEVRIDGRALTLGPREIRLVEV